MIKRKHDLLRTILNTGTECLESSDSKVKAISKLVQKGCDSHKKHSRMSSGTLRMFLGQGQANKRRAPHVWPRPCTSMQKGHFNMFCQPEGHFIMFHRPWGASKRALLGHSSKHGGTLRSAWAHIAKTLRDLGQHSVAALMSFISLCTRISGGVGGLSKQRGFHTSTSACTGSCGLHEHDHGCGHTNVHGAVYTFECTSQC